MYYERRIFIQPYLAWFVRVEERVSVGTPPLLRDTFIFSPFSLPFPSPIFLAVRAQLRFPTTRTPRVQRAHLLWARAVLGNRRPCSSQHFVRVQRSSKNTQLLSASHLIYSRTGTKFVAVAVNAKLPYRMRSTVFLEGVGVFAASLQTLLHMVDRSAAPMIYLLCSLVGEFIGVNVTKRPWL